MKIAFKFLCNIVTNFIDILLDPLEQDFSGFCAWLLSWGLISLAVGKLIDFIYHMSNPWPIVFLAGAFANIAIVFLYHITNAICNIITKSWRNAKRGL